MGRRRTLRNLSMIVIVSGAVATVSALPQQAGAENLRTTSTAEAAGIGEGISSGDPGVHQIVRQPAGPPPTPPHTGIKAMVKELAADVRHLPSKENLFWASVGGGLALAVHPVDDNLHDTLVDSRFADRFFKPGAVMGELPTLLTSAAVVYTIGRVSHTPKVSHMGSDLIQALAVSEALTQALSTRRVANGPTAAAAIPFLPAMRPTHSRLRQHSKGTWDGRARFPRICFRRMSRSRGCPRIDTGSVTQSSDRQSGSSRVGQ